jgi:purine-cytosine permease-like protein
MSIIVLALAWGGRDKLEEIINNLLSILGYWTLAFGLILAIEHFWFRPRMGGYDLSAWQDPKRMPAGLAGTTALLAGIGFSFLGMNQTWVGALIFLLLAFDITDGVVQYRSPVAKHIGSSGGDVGDYLVFASVLILYPLLRTLEIRIVGR